MSNGGLISGAFSSTSGLATSVITTRGDIIRGNASGNRSRYAIGSAGTVLASDGTDPSWTAHSALKIPVALEVACSDEETALTTGTAKVTFRMPYAMTLSAGEAGMRASLRRIRGPPLIASLKGRVDGGSRQERRTVSPGAMAVASGLSEPAVTSH